eukprot:scaffold1766_cov401-Prasinococcus_capsulatus_cf.AAC.2
MCALSRLGIATAAGPGVGAGTGPLAERPVRWLQEMLMKLSGASCAGAAGPGLAFHRVGGVKRSEDPLLSIRELFARDKPPHSAHALMQTDSKASSPSPRAPDQFENLSGQSARAGRPGHGLQRIESHTHGCRRQFPGTTVFGSYPEQLLTPSRHATQQDSGLCSWMVAPSLGDPPTASWPTQGSAWESLHAGGGGDGLSPRPVAAVGDYARWAFYARVDTKNHMLHEE